MAIRVEQAQAMIVAAEKAGVVLQVGHSHSYDLPIARMREIVASGSLGRARMIHTWNFTDWMARPRRAAELDVAQGGGVTYRQGAHQIDIFNWWLDAHPVNVIAAGGLDYYKDRDWFDNAMVIYEYELPLMGDDGKQVAGPDGNRVTRPEVDEREREAPPLGDQFVTAAPRVGPRSGAVQDHGARGGLRGMQPRRDAEGVRSTEMPHAFAKHGVVPREPNRTPDAISTSRAPACRWRQLSLPGWSRSKP